MLSRSSLVLANLALAHVVVVATALAPTASAAISVGQSFAGDATYYGAGNDRRGACGGNGKPTGPGGITTVAINSQQWEGGNNCGICIEGRGTGVGAGGNPVGTFFAAVNNLCPECKYGDIDFAMNGDGRWKVEWKRVDCASKSGRKLLQANADTAAFLDMLRGGGNSSSSSAAAAAAPSSSGVQAVVGAFAPAAAKVVENVPASTVDKVKDAAASVASSFAASRAGSGSRRMMASPSSSDLSSSPLSSVAELAASPSSAGFESVLGAFAPAAQILAPTVRKVADSLSEETVSKVRDAASSVAESVSKSLNSRKMMEAAA